MTRNGVLAALLLAFAPLPLGAQGGSVDFGIVCTPGALRACASVSAWAVHGTNPNGSIYTDIFYRVSNVQGQPGFDYNPRGLNFIRTHNVTSTTGFGFGSRSNLVAQEGNTSQGGSIPGAPLDSPNDPTYSGLSATLLWNFDNMTAMWGCDVPPPEHWGLFGYDATCGGAFTYSFRYELDHLSLNQNTQITLGFTALEPDGTGAYDETRVSCTTGTDCVAVVPEPITLVLLGSGLVGVGGVMRRRRREELDATDDEGASV